MDDETEIVEGELVPPPVKFPVAGRDLTPTDVALEAGKHGNGSWNVTDGSVQLAYAEVHQSKKEEKDARRDHFNEEAKDALSEAVDLHRRAIRVGLGVMEKIENGDAPKGWELALLNKALASAKELTDRAAGKARTATDDGETTTGLTFLLAGASDDG